jgi:anti-sigma regulatory factor (Ser/Thr protein kinase)
MGSRDVIPTAAAVDPSGAAECAPLAAPGGAFSHEVLFYSGDEGFVRATRGSVRQARARGAGVLVAVAPARAAALAEDLGQDADGVRFVDMPELGRNPARIIPVWRDFVSEHARGEGGAVGIGEPVWPGRSAEELGECVRHESLLNLAFAGGPGWRLLCPYDVDGLDDGVIEAAHATHPRLCCDGSAGENDRYTGAHGPPRPFAGALTAAPDSAEEMGFSSRSLVRVREAVADFSTRAGLGVEGTEQLVLAVDELASNSIRHGGGAGVLRYWRELELLVCEVEDGGRIEDPLVGRTRPEPEAFGGRGVWLVNQLCDLVQIRSGLAGSIVRVHKRVAP